MASVRYWKQRIKSNILGIPALGEMLSATTVEAACDEEGHVWRRSFWSPSVTLTTFLIQVQRGEDAAGGCRVPADATGCGWGVGPALRGRDGLLPSAATLPRRGYRQDAAPISDAVAGTDHER